MISVNNGLLVSSPTWYCALDFSLIVTTVVTSIELAALLSIIRYNKICLFKQVKPMRYYICVLISVALSLILSGFHSYYNSYSWYELDYYCVPSIDVEKDNTTYFTLFYTIYSLRVLICLLIVCFCYSNIMIAYFRIMNPSIVLNTTAIDSNSRINNYQLNNEGSGLIQYKLTINGESNKSMVESQKQGSITQINSSESQSPTVNQLRLKKVMLILKISLIIVCYIVCLLPDVTITLLSLTKTNFNMQTTFYSNCFILCLGFTSSCFILLIHRPIQKCFFKCLKLK
ncbi:hypothetical protein K502DRAFT_349358 [Neoconidiobolus thromboides FSU 785]|nr:hypothetical protein K502DRAFT_349358 [Neoconidiobolus thromboides FSU 785]